MNKLLSKLVIRWIITFLMISLVSSIGFATLVSGIIYSYKGFPELNSQTWSALKIIWFFWLSIGYGVGIITGVVFALKTLLYRCVENKRLVLIDCKGERVDLFGSKPYFKFWRKWFFTLIWINVTQVIVAIGTHKLLVGGEIWLGWFNGISMGLMIIVSGALALIWVVSRSKRVRLELCE